MATRTITDEAEAIELGLALGYDYLATPDKLKPLTEYVLPVNAFTVTEHYVLVRELIRDSHGRAIRHGSHPLVKHTIRPLPRKAN